MRLADELIARKKAKTAFTRLFRLNGKKGWRQLELVRRKAA